MPSVKTTNTWTILGWGMPKNFDTFAFTQVLEYARYEVLKNDVFVIGNRVIRQVRGVAIGGTLSAQLACLYAIHREHQFFNREWSVVHKEVAEFIRPMAVPAFPFRFRDNLVGAAVGQVPIAALQALYTRLYGLTLQEEGWGPDLTTLESNLHMNACTGQVTVSLKNKLRQYHGDQRLALIRYPDWYAPNAKAVLRSLVPGLVQKCLFYASSPGIQAQNVQQTLQELYSKGYPGKWWKPAFNRTLRRHGAPRELVRAAQQSPFWRHSTGGKTPGCSK